jgi:hypothetical protein
MMYSKCTFLDCYHAFSPLQAYSLPTHGNGEVTVLGKLHYILPQSNNPQEKEQARNRSIDTDKSAGRVLPSLHSDYKH